MRNLWGCTFILSTFAADIQALERVLSNSGTLLFETQHSLNDGIRKKQIEPPFTSSALFFFDNP